MTIALNCEGCIELTEMGVRARCIEGTACTKPPDSKMMSKMTSTTSLSSYLSLTTCYVVGTILCTFYVLFQISTPVCKVDIIMHILQVSKRRCHRFCRVVYRVKLELKSPGILTPKPRLLLLYWGPPLRHEKPQWVWGVFIVVEVRLGNERN